MNDQCASQQSPTLAGFFLRFRFGDRKEILRDRLEEF